MIVCFHFVECENMRIFAVSDLHIDYDENRKWLFNLSDHRFKKDILILGGDITHNEPLMVEALSFLSRIFYKVIFVPGNHDVWVRQDDGLDSLEKFYHILSLCRDIGVVTQPFLTESLLIVPLFAWYDYSFGRPAEKLLSAWRDFYTCSWPDSLDPEKLTDFFLELNEPNLKASKRFTITVSHFLPTLDLLSRFNIPVHKRYIFPVLGAEKLNHQIKKLRSMIHVFGHSHINQNHVMGETRYINNAFGYPYETAFTKKALICIHET